MFTEPKLSSSHTGAAAIEALDIFGVAEVDRISGLQIAVCGGGHRAGMSNTPAGITECPHNRTANLHKLKTSYRSRLSSSMSVETLSPCQIEYLQPHTRSTTSPFHLLTIAPKHHSRVYHHFQTRCDLQQGLTQTFHGMVGKQCPALINNLALLSPLSTDRHIKFCGTIDPRQGSKVPKTVLGEKHLKGVGIMVLVWTSWY